jgi:hypothetical protein
MWSSRRPSVYGFHGPVHDSVRGRRAHIQREIYLKAIRVVRTYGEARLDDFERIGPVLPFCFTDMFMRSRRDAILPFFFLSLGVPRDMVREIVQSADELAQRISEAASQEGQKQKIVMHDSCTGAGVNRSLFTLCLSAGLFLSHALYRILCLYSVHCRARSYLTNLIADP